MKLTCCIAIIVAVLGLAGIAKPQSELLNWGQKGVVASVGAYTSDKNHGLTGTLGYTAGGGVDFGFTLSKVSAERKTWFEKTVDVDCWTLSQEATLHLFHSKAERNAVFYLSLIEAFRFWDDTELLDENELRLFKVGGRMAIASKPATNRFMTFFGISGVLSSERDTDPYAALELGAGFSHASQMSVSLIQGSVTLSDEVSTARVTVGIALTGKGRR